MKHQKLIKKLEDGVRWEEFVPGLLLTIKEVNTLIKALKGDK